MASTKKPAATAGKKPGTPKPGARNPGGAAPSPDAMTRQLNDTQATAAAIAYNANKAAEHGHANALAPPEGQRVTPASRLVGASSLSEVNASGKTGAAAPTGSNPTVEPLDWVRVDFAAAGVRRCHRATSSHVRLSPGRQSPRRGEPFDPAQDRLRAALRLGAQ